MKLIFNILRLNCIKILRTYVEESLTRFEPEYLEYSKLVMVETTPDITLLVKWEQCQARNL